MTTTFGRHELVDELYRTEFGFVGTARPAGSPARGAATLLIKVFSPTVGEPAARQAEADSFVERARLQEQLAASALARHWAHIHEVGRTADGGGAFYVTDYHPLTLRKLLDARLEISASALHRMVTGIVAGLRELNLVYGRAHANLKPGNVLLVGRGDVAGAGVALTDPASASMASSVGEAGDRFALGQIIHELVLQRPFDSGSVWPLPLDPTWEAQLGRTGEGWRRLCDDLLAPTPSPRVATTKALARQVRRLTPKRRGLLGPVPLAAAALLVVAIGGAVLYSGYSARHAYCAAKEQWLDAFARAVKEPARRDLYRQDATLKKVVEEFGRLDPADVDCHGRAVPLSIEEFVKMRAAMQSLDRVNVALDPENWPAVANAAKAQRRFRSRGWHQPADYLATLVAGVRPGGKDLAGGIDRFLLVGDFEASVAAVEEDWKRLEAGTKALEGSSDPTFRAIGKMLRASAVTSVRLTNDGFQGLEQIPANAGLAARASTALATAGSGKTDLARFSADLTADVPLDQLKPADVERWLGKLDVYAIRTGDIQPVVVALRQRLGDVAREVVSSKPDQAKKALYDRDRIQVEADITALERSPLIEAEVRQGVLTKRRGELTAAVESLLKYRRPQSPAEWIQTLPALATTSPRVNEYWQSWKRVLPGRIPEIDRPGGAEVFEAIKKHTNGLWNALEALDKDFPRPPDGLSPAFAAAAIEKREAALDALLQAMTSATDGIRTDAVAKATADYKSWLTNLAALANDFPIRKELLGIGDRPDEGWNKNQPAFWEDALVRRLVEPDLNRIVRLQSLRSLPRAELSQTAAEDTETEVVLASWRLLGALKAPPWPAARGELDAEAKLSRRVQDMLAGVTVVAERDAALADVRRQGPIRWRRAVEAASAESQLASALELRRVFGIDVEQYRQLNPEARFNLALFTARTLALRQEDDAAMRPLVDALTETARELKGRAGSEDLLYKLGRLDAKEPFSDQDPGSFFRPTVLGVQLEFKRVELRNLRPFYLSTTELTVEQFGGLIAGAKAWEEAQRLPWNHAPGQREAGRGPRGWEWTGVRGSGIGVADFWQHPEEYNDYPPEFLASRFNRTALKEEVGGNPTLGHPIQQVSAQAALYVAGLAGCRLPTSREWLASHAVFEKDVPRDRWNLRDQTWDAQRQHVAGLSKPEGRWPDLNAFVPERITAPTGAAAVAGKATDGTLFFRAAADGGGGTFHGLVGNVAEFVCDAPGQFEARPDKATADGIAKFAADAADQLFVIGGSALSPPEVDPDTPYPLGPSDRAYSDVGVRLAFTAPVKSLSERLKWVLLEQPYMWNEPAPAAAPAKAAIGTPTPATLAADASPAAEH